MRLAVLATAASAIALCFAAAAPASAATTTWDVVSGYDGNLNNGTNSVWEYGWTTAATGFILFDHNNTSNCITAGLECWQSPDPQLFVPLVAKNVSGSTLTYANTVVQPTDVLNLHPGGTQDGSTTGGNDIDTVVRFIAPTAGSYNFDGFFEELDISPTGTPVSISGAADKSTLTTGAPTDFDFTVALTAGQTVDFVVNRDGNYGND